MLPLKKYKYSDYLKNIVGIEKEYRLSKVAKVAAFMYKQDDIKILYKDALKKIDDVKTNDYSVLVANPPYSVKGFLETLDEQSLSEYKLCQSIDNKSYDTNNAIETFFIEKAKMLMQPNAVMGIILPSSILVKENKLYTQAREILLQYFYIVSIVELQSRTFGKTGTNTVILFAIKKPKVPEPAEHWRCRVQNWFKNSKNKTNVYDDEHIIEHYCQLQNYPLDDYKKFLKWQLNPRLLDTEIFKEYLNNYCKKNKIKDFNTLLENETERNKFIEYLQDLEKDKLWYYALAQENPMPVLVVRYENDNNKQKDFLGYEWRGRKGSEGIRYINQNKNTKKDEDTDNEDDNVIIELLQGIQNIQTPMFNPKDFNDLNKINYYIQQNFLNEQPAIPQDVQPFINYFKLTDMLDFSKVEFNKNIHLAPKNIVLNFQIKMTKNYQRSKLESLIIPINFNQIKIKKTEYLSTGKFPIISQDSDKFISGYTNKSNPINELPLILFGDHTCILKYIDFPFFPGADGTKLIVINKEIVITKFVYFYLQLVEIENEKKYERHFKYLKNIEIPIPPKPVQERIVAECEKVDREVENITKQIEACKFEIEDLVNGIEGNGKKVKLNEIAEMIKGTSITKEKTNEGNIPVVAGGINFAYFHNVANRPKNIITVSSSGANAGFINFWDVEIFASDCTTINNLNSKNLNNKLLFYILKSKQDFFYSIRKGMAQPHVYAKDFENLEIYIPQKENFKNILEQIEIIEKKKKELEEKLNKFVGMKKLIIEKEG